MFGVEFYSQGEMGPSGVPGLLRHLRSNPHTPTPLLEQNMPSSCTARERSSPTSRRCAWRSRLRPTGSPAPTKASRLCPSISASTRRTVRPGPAPGLWAPSLSPAPQDHFLGPISLLAPPCAGAPPPADSAPTAAPVSSAHSTRQPRSAVTPPSQATPPPGRRFSPARFPNPTHLWPLPLGHPFFLNLPAHGHAPHLEPPSHRSAQC